MCLMSKPHISLPLSESSAGNCTYVGSSGSVLALKYALEMSMKEIWVLSSDIGSQHLLDLFGRFVVAMLSIVRNANGSITVTFEGKLQSTEGVNTTWAAVDSESPAVLPAKKAAAFFRAVR